MDPEIKLTGPQIAYIRRKLGATQMALAKRIAASQAALCRREKNPKPQTGPEIILISLLAKSAGIDVPAPAQVEQALHDLASLNIDISAEAAEVAA